MKFVHLFSCKAVDQIALRRETEMLKKVDDIRAKLLTEDKIKKYIDGDTSNGVDKLLAILPLPDVYQRDAGGSVSVDLRLGRWFLTMRASRHPVMDLAIDRSQHEVTVTNRHFVAFGDQFILHPGKFVLGATLEWVRLPSNLAAYVSGKSSLGRRGLIIETAMGVHPGFSGCITLEIANVGEIPIALRLGMQICQCYFHELIGDTGNISRSLLAGFRRPTLKNIEVDSLVAKMKERFEA